MLWMNAEVKALDDTIHAAADKAHFTYDDALDAFRGHELCNGKATEYMNRAVIPADRRAGSFHPTVDGQATLATLIARSAS